MKKERCCYCGKELTSGLILFGGKKDSNDEIKYLDENKSIHLACYIKKVIEKEIELQKEKI